MVGRFESAELKQEAAAHESLHGRQGMVGRCGCLVGVACVVFGFAAPLFSASFDALFSASPPAPAPLPVRQQPPIMTVTGYGSMSSYVPPIYGTAPYSTYGSGDYGRSSDSYTGYGSPSMPFVEGVTYMGQGQGADRWRGLGVDSTLLALLVSVLALCLWPQIRGQKPPSGTPPWAAAVSGSRPDPRQAMFGTSDFGAGGPRNIIDVRPGELGGSQCGRASGLFGEMVPTGGAWPPAPAPTTTNSWNTPVPRPGFAPPGAPGALGAAPGQGGGAGLGGLVSAAGSWLAGLGGTRRGAGLPTEAEVQETYMNFSVELPQWSAAMSTLIQQQVLEPLLKQLEDSDREWTKAMKTLGYRLSMDAPRVFGWPHGIGVEAKELSVHETNLPEELAGQPGATHKWQRRQLLETFLKHPSFEPAQRQHVLERLCQWRHVGLARSLQGLRCGMESMQGEAALPTDAHILENLVVKMLQQTPGLDFASRFWASAGSNGPPCGSRGDHGLPLVAWLRQVTDQESTWPRPAPHYEVVTPTKTWKLRPSPLNILEALALLLHELRKCPQSYQLFDDALRKVVERVDDYRNNASGGLSARGFSMF